MVGNFEEMYQDFLDPWHQSEVSHVKNSARVAVINWAERLSIEIGGVKGPRIRVRLRAYNSPT